MFDLTERDDKAKQVAMYYAEKLQCSLVLDIFSQTSHDHSRQLKDIANKEEAVILSQFFWDAFDAAAQDREAGIVVLGEANLAPWFERLMHIIGGHLVQLGYQTEWDRVCDES